MCLVMVYRKETRDADSRELMLADAARIECGEREVLVSDLFGQSRRVEGRVRTIDLINNEVIIEQQGSVAPEGVSGSERGRRSRPRPRRGHAAD